MRVVHKKNSRIVGTIARHVKDNAKAYLFVACILLIGITIGVIFVNNLGETQVKEVEDYINNFINSLKNDSKIDTGKLLQSSIQHNIIMVLIMWFVGSTVIRYTYSTWTSTI